MNDQLLIDRWREQAPTEYAAPIALTTEQTASIRFDYLELAGGAVAQLFWSSTTQSKQIIPQSQLFLPQPTPIPTRTLTPTLTPSRTPSFTPTPTDTLVPTETSTGTATATPAGDLIFRDGFENGLAMWSSATTDGGDLSTSGAAGIAGGFGMQAVIDDNTAIYVTDQTPASVTRYRARF